VIGVAPAAVSMFVSPRTSARSVVMRSRTFSSQDFALHHLVNFEQLNAAVEPSSPCRTLAAAAVAVAAPSPKRPQSQCRPLAAAPVASP